MLQPRSRPCACIRPLLPCLEGDLGFQTGRGREGQGVTQYLGEPFKLPVKGLGGHTSSAKHRLIVKTSKQPPFDQEGRLPTSAATLPTASDTMLTIPQPGPGPEPDSNPEADTTRSSPTDTAKATDTATATATAIASAAAAEVAPGHAFATRRRTTLDQDTVAKAHTVAEHQGQGFGRSEVTVRIYSTSV